VHCKAVETVRQIPGRRAARKHLTGDEALIADISTAMGLGGIFNWTGRILELAEKRHVPIEMRFSAPTYRPSWPVTDWLDCYFVRRRPGPADAVVVPAAALPLAAVTSPINELAGRVWDYLAIRPEMTAAAVGVPFESFAAVHFRGGDKYLEKPRVSYDLVLRRLEQEMQRDGLRKAFVASDEEAFVALARSRFGDDCWALPLNAVTTNGRPPHFSDVPGETKASEALATMALLARAQLCVRTESLLSEWAMTLPGQRRVVLVLPGQS
jgi:hypothetical protein